MEVMHTLGAPENPPINTNESSQDPQNRQQQVPVNSGVRHTRVNDIDFAGTRAKNVDGDAVRRPGSSVCSKTMIRVMKALPLTQVVFMTGVERAGLLAITLLKIKTKLQHYCYFKLYTVH